MSDNCGCGRYGCTCVDYSIDNVTASNDDFILRMRHLKCRVTHLVRNQMRKSMSESRETNYSSYPASSKSSSKSVNNKGTQLSSSSSINLHGNKVIDHTNTRQLNTTSQEYTTDSSIRNYSTSSVEESKPAVVTPTQQTNRKQPIGHSTVINPTISTRISLGSDVQRSYVPHDIAVIHPPAPAPPAKIVPVPKPIPSPTTQSVAVETLPNMSDLTEYTPSNFYQHDNTMVDSSTQATSQVTTSTQATDSINRATSTAKIQTDLITSTTTATTTTRNTTTFIGIICDGLISISSFLYRIKKIIFMILLMGLLLWAAVIYGAILGAAICTKTGGYPLFQITLPPSKPVFF